MSYILDALKKSEQERKKGAVPGLGTVQGLPGGRSGDNGFRPYYLRAALLLLLALVALAWWFLREPAPKPTKTSPVTTSAKLSQPPAAEPKAAPPETPLAPNKSEPQAKKSPEPTPAPNQPPSPKSPSTNKSASTKAPVAPLALPKASVPSPAATVAGPPPAPRPIPEGYPLKATVPTPARKAAAPPAPEKISPPPAKAMESAESAPPSDTPTEETAPVVIKPEDMPIVPLAELPAEAKEGMPEVKIGMHFFSDDPPSRRAAVNGRLLREGQPVEKDLFLKEITREGVVLAFRGRRVSLAVFPR